jgi:hypothetical protein
MRASSWSRNLALSMIASRMARRSTGGLRTHRKTPPERRPLGVSRIAQEARRGRRGSPRRPKATDGPPQRLRKNAGAADGEIDAVLREAARRSWTRARPAPAALRSGAQGAAKPLEEERAEGRREPCSLDRACCLARGGSPPCMPTHTDHRSRAERALPEGRRASQWARPQPNRRSQSSHPPSGPTERRIRFDNCLCKLLSSGLGRFLRHRCVDPMGACKVGRHL